MISNQIKLDNTQIFSDFDKHISIEGNDRILFSAPFGTGKSTYLTEYFEHNVDNYFCFNLYPVNYSISQNEDIFELIKFDLLLQLMGNYRNEIDLKTEEFSNILSFQALFLKEVKLTSILLSLLGESGKIGKSAKVLIDEVKKQYEEFKEKFENEEQFIEDYLTNFENKKGNVNEMDAYSLMVEKLLERVQSKNESKISVLIIDDLDRLDPEHIFRLFNIFSVNFGKSETLNKFGFSKIIFVCDIENIKHIYKHKYGQEVDFNGYINKFYSYYPFLFDNKKVIKNKLEDILASYENNDVVYFENRRGAYYQEYTALKVIISNFLDLKLINLRMIIELKDLNIPNKEYPYRFFNVNINRYKVISLFFIFRNMFGDLKTFNSSLNKLIEFNPTYLREEEVIISLCIPFLIEYTEAGVEINVESISSSSKKKLQVKDFECFIYFVEQYDSDIEGYYFRFDSVTTNDGFDSKVDLNPFKILKYTLQKCLKIPDLF